MRTFWLALQLTALASFTACAGGSHPLCEAVEGTICEDCYGELVTCSFDGVQVTEQSCRECQAQADLYLKLCSLNSQATPEEVESGMVCEVVDTGM